MDPWLLPSMQPHYTITTLDKLRVHWGIQTTYVVMPIPRSNKQQQQQTNHRKLPQTLIPTMIQITLRTIAITMIRITLLITITMTMVMTNKKNAGKKIAILEIKKMEIEKTT